MRKERKKTPPPAKENPEAKLKKTNTKLRASVKQLRKQLKQIENELSEWRGYFQPSDSPTEIIVEDAVAEIKTTLCPKCSSSTIDIPAGVFIVRKCTSDECKWSERK